MKPIIGWALALVVAAGAAGALWARQHATPPEAAAAPAEPVALVRTELAKDRVLTDSLDAFGEVSPGPLAGLSFPRAGQITRLAALPGDLVAKGTALATLRLDPAALESYLQSVNTLAAARREADRLRQLLALQLATQSQLDAADKAVLDATGAVRALNAQGGGSTSSTLVAPFDGVVTSVAAAQGDRVAPGAPILQLAHADSLRVQIGIEPAQSRRVKVGTKALIQPVLATPEAAPTIESSVAGVQDIVDPKTQMVSAIVNLPRASGNALVPGMKVRASLLVASHSAVAVPRNAVLTDAKGAYVYQVVAGKARRVDVVRGIESDGRVGIAGLKDLALPVVTVGNYELRDGMAVKEAPQ